MLQSAYCVLSFEDHNLTNPIPDLEKYSKVSRALDTYQEVDPYSKYRLVRYGQSKNPDESREDEDFKWYNPDSDTTYFCLNMNNTLYVLLLCSTLKGQQLFNCYGRRNNGYLLLK